MNFYLWIKAAHIISMVCWMAGLLYFVRLLVYHAMETEAVVKERFSIMENRLYRNITAPGLMATVTFGIILIGLQPGLMKHGWLHIKLLFVFFLIGFTHMSKKWARELQQETSTKSHKFFRVANEIPTLLMILIVLLVVLQPFNS